MHNYKDNMAYQLADAVGTGSLQPAVHAMQNQCHRTSVVSSPQPPRLPQLLFGVARS